MGGRERAETLLRPLSERLLVLQFGRRIPEPLAFGGAGGQHGGPPTMPLILTLISPLWCRHRLGSALLVAALAMGGLAGCADEDKSSVATGTEPPSPVALPAQAEMGTPGAAEEYQRIVAELRRASECVTAVEASPEFAPLRVKAPDRSQNDPYPRALLDKSKATPAEQKLLARLIERIASCQPSFGVLMVPMHQSLTRMIDVTWQQQGELYRHLAEGAISWGLFNQGVRSNADRLAGAVQAISDTRPTSAMAQMPVSGQMSPGPMTSGAGGPVVIRPAEMSTQAVPASPSVPLASPQMMAGRSQSDVTAVPLPPPLPVPSAPSVSPAPLAAQARQAEAQASAGGWRIHLASYRSAKAADLGWEALRHAAPTALESLSPSKATVTLKGRGEFVRLLAGPFEDRAAAEKVCALLSQSHLYCLPLAPGRGAS